MSDKKIWQARFFVRLFRSVEPLLRRLRLYRNPSTAGSGIVKEYERIFYSWAKENRVMIICGHSHRAIFASKSYCERLKEEISGLEEEKELYRDNAEKVEGYMVDINKKRKAIAEERYKGREIEPVDPDGNPSPCYFNTGCALYTDGITAIEIADGQIELVKWHVDKNKDGARKIYQSGSLNEFASEVKGVVEAAIPRGKARRLSKSTSKAIA
jgi:hypothetical protein